MPPRLRKCFQSCRDVYTVAVDIAVLNDNVAGINADPKLAPIARDACVTVNHSSLHRNGTGDCVDDARKLDQDTVTRGFDNATTCDRPPPGRLARDAASW